MYGIYIFHNVAGTHVRENSVIQLVAETKGKEMKAANSSENYGCLTVDRE